MINFAVTNDYISGSVQGVSFSRHYNEEVFQKMINLKSQINHVLETEFSTDTMALTNSGKELIKQYIEEFNSLLVEDPAESMKKIHPNLTVDGAGNLFITKDDVVFDIKLPESLSKKIKELIASDHSVDGLVKFVFRVFRVFTHPRNNFNTSKENCEIFFQDVCDYIFNPVVDEDLRDQFIEQGFTEEAATEKATFDDVELTEQGQLVVDKVVCYEEALSKFKFVYDEDGNVKRVPKVEQTLNEETGEVTYEDPNFAEDFVCSPFVYKSGEDFYCGSELGQKYKVGSIAALPDWNSVNCNRNEACRKGLHFGGKNYVKYWENETNLTMRFILDPMDIGCVSVNDGCTVIRALKAFPIGFRNRKIMNKNVYSPAAYAIKSDKEWEEYKQQVLEEYQKKIAKVNLI